MCPQSCAGQTHPFENKFNTESRIIYVRRSRLLGGKHKKYRFALFVGCFVMSSWTLYLWGTCEPPDEPLSWLREARCHEVFLETGPELVANAGRIKKSVHEACQQKDSGCWDNLGWLEDFVGDHPIPSQVPQKACHFSVTEALPKNIQKPGVCPSAALFVVVAVSCLIDTEALTKQITLVGSVTRIMPREMPRLTKRILQSHHEMLLVLCNSEPKA